MKYRLALFIIFGGAIVGFSQNKPITFTDDSTLEITNEQKSESAAASKISVKYKSFAAVFGSIGKTVAPLDEKTLKKLARTDKKLAAEIKKINTAYAVVQNDARYYLATFNSVDFENFRACDSENNCRIKCDAVIVSLENKGVKENVLIIKSIQKLK